MTSKLRRVFLFSVLCSSLIYSSSINATNSIVNNKIQLKDPYISYNFNGNINDEKNNSNIVFFGNPTVTYNEQYIGEKFLNSLNDINKVVDDKRNNTNIEFNTEDDDNYIKWTSDKDRGGAFYIDTNKTSIKIEDEYTIALKFRFDEIKHNWTKIIDAKNSLSDNGFYLRGTDGKIIVYSGGDRHANGKDKDIAKVSKNELVDMIVSRTKDNKFNVWIVKNGGTNEEKILEIFKDYDDSAKNLVFSEVNAKNRIGFFFDDTSTEAEATKGGKVYKIQMWGEAINIVEATNSINDKTPPTIDVDDNIEVNIGDTINIPISDNSNGNITIETPDLPNGLIANFDNEKQPNELVIDTSNVENPKDVVVKIIAKDSSGNTSNKNINLKLKKSLPFIEDLYKDKEKDKNTIIKYIKPNLKIDVNFGNTNSNKLKDTELSFKENIENVDINLKDKSNENNLKTKELEIDTSNLRFTNNDDKVYNFELIATEGNNSEKKEITLIVKPYSSLFEFKENDNIEKIDVNTTPKKDEIKNFVKLVGTPVLDLPNETDFSLNEDKTKVIITFPDGSKSEIPVNIIKNNNNISDNSNNSNNIIDIINIISNNITDSNNSNNNSDTVINVDDTNSNPTNNSDNKYEEIVEVEEKNSDSNNNKNVNKKVLPKTAINSSLKINLLILLSISVILINLKKLLIKDK